MAYLILHFVKKILPAHACSTGRSLGRKTQGIVPDLKTWLLQRLYQRNTIKVPEIHYRLRHTGRSHELPQRTAQDLAQHKPSISKGIYAVVYQQYFRNRLRTAFLSDL